MKFRGQSQAVNGFIYFITLPSIFVSREKRHLRSAFYCRCHWNQPNEFVFLPREVIKMTKGNS